MRIVMGQDSESVGLANVSVLNIRGPMHDWKLVPLGKTVIPVREDSDNVGTEDRVEKGKWRKENEANMLAAYEEALPGEQRQEIAALAKEKSKAFGGFAAEAYYNEIYKIDNVNIVGI